MADPPPARPGAPGDTTQSRLPHLLPIPRLVSRALGLALVGLVALGSALRIYTYAANRSLWLDEAALANNIVARGFTELAAPLDRLQVAPLGFLWLEKLAVSLLGPSEYALRLVPLIAGLAGLLLFAQLARRMLRPLAATFSLTIFAVAIPLIYFSAETKQYSLDVAVAIALLLLALPGARESHEPRHALPLPITPARAAALAVLGSIAPWLSQPSVFTLGAVALYLLLPYLRGRARLAHTDPPPPERRRAVRVLVAVFVLWAANAGASILHSLFEIGVDGRGDLDRFWGQAFLPISAGLTESVRWLGGTAMEVFSWLLPVRVAPLALALFLLGIIALLRRRNGSATLVLAPLVFALIASALGLYPFTYRLALFAAPSLLITTGAGAELLLGAAWKLGLLVLARWESGGPPGAVGIGSALAAPLAAFGVLAVLLAACIPPLSELPFQREELRPVVRYVARHRDPGDVIYVYYGAGRAFEYYARRAGIPSSAYRIGQCSREDWRGYLREIDTLRGRSRVWLVLSHPFIKGGIREDSLLVRYFSRVGKRVESTSAPGALAQLYDLSEAPGARQAGAAFTLPTSADSSYASVGCIGVVTN